MPSKVFGPTASAADTLTQIGTTYQMPPGNWTIYKVLVGKGNVVNGTINAGTLLLKTVERSYYFAYGNGGGGATNNAQNGPAEPIEMAVNAPGNTNISVYVLDVNVAADVTISVQFSPSSAHGIVGKLKANPATFRTLAAGGVGANADTAADTEESMTAEPKLTGGSLQPELNGRIYQIRFAGTGIVDAKAGTHLLKVYVPGESGPFEYAIGNGPGGATLGGPQWADVIDIPDGIPVKSASTIDVKITSAEVCKSPKISLSYW